MLVKIVLSPSFKICAWTLLPSTRQRYRKSRAVYSMTMGASVSLPPARSRAQRPRNGCFLAYAKAFTASRRMNSVSSCGLASRARLPSRSALVMDSSLRHFPFLPRITVNKRIRSSGPTMRKSVSRRSPTEKNVEKLDAAAAVAKYRPNVVIACWVTHRFDPYRPYAGGSVTGVDEASIIESCDEYIFIGNEHVHAHKPIWKMPHEKLTPRWLYSRAVNGSREFIATWRRSQSSSA